jgi:V8-like Glu-specific endopeptidase
MGPCPGEPIAIAGQDNIDTTAVVALEDMKRFANDNFKFVVKRDPSKFGLPKDDDDMLTEDDIPENEDKTSEETNVRARRMTPDGYEYVAEFKIEDLPSYEDAEPDPRGNEQGLRHRSLVVGVIGVDTRSKISDTTAFPFRTIAHVDYDSGSGGCTSTMISRDTALTCAHCVYSYGDQAWYLVTKIAPGRYRSGGTVYEPYVVWYVDYTQIFQSFIDEGKRNRDIGIMKLHPKTINGCEHTYPGDAVGYAGFARPSIGDFRLTNSRVTGYPGDKPFGEMWTSGQCSPGWLPAGLNYGFHFCDMTFGNSGSSILTTDRKSLGANSHAFYNPTTGESVVNGACLMHGWMYDSIYEWLGRGTDLPSSILFFSFLFPLHLQDPELWYLLLKCPVNRREAR